MQSPAGLFESIQTQEAERAGFEPAVRFDPDTSLAMMRIRPLCHLSGSCDQFEEYRFTAPERKSRGRPQIASGALISDTFRKFKSEMFCPTIQSSERHWMAGWMSFGRVSEPRERSCFDRIASRARPETVNVLPGNCRFQVSVQRM